MYKFFSSATATAVTAKSSQELPKPNYTKNKRRKLIKHKFRKFMKEELVEKRKTCNNLPSFLQTRRRRNKDFVLGTVLNERRNILQLAHHKVGMACKQASKHPSS